MHGHLNVKVGFLVHWFQENDSKLVAIRKFSQSNYGMTILIIMCVAEI